MTDTEVKMIKAELNKLAAKDKFSNIHECTLKLINLYEAIILGNQMEIAELKKENEQLKTVCDYNCPVHKLATHNACLTCLAVRNSPHHDLKNVTDEELQKIIKDAETEMEM